MQIELHANARSYSAFDLAIWYERFLVFLPLRAKAKASYNQYVTAFLRCRCQLLFLRSQFVTLKGYLTSFSIVSGLVPMSMIAESFLPKSLTE